MKVTEYWVAIRDKNGKSMQLLVRFNRAGVGVGTWNTRDRGYFCYENGVLDAGYYPTMPFAWLALYGGPRIDDSKLVLHFDNFHTDTIVNRRGSGKVYPQDHLVISPGEIQWELIV